VSFLSGLRARGRPGIAIGFPGASFLQYIVIYVRSDWPCVGVAFFVGAERSAVAWVGTTSFFGCGPFLPVFRAVIPPLS
jgi:hypothetical protein